MPFKILLVIILFALPLVPTFWAILDIPKRQFASTRARVVWFAAVASLPFFGAMFYILVGRRNTQPASTSNSTEKGGPPAPNPVNTKEEIKTDA